MVVVEGVEEDLGLILEVVGEAPVRPEKKIWTRDGGSACTFSSVCVSVCLLCPNIVES